MIRSATLSDFQAVLPLLRRVFEQSPYGGSVGFDELHIRRMFVVAVTTPNFFVEVVEVDGSLRGLMCGVVTENFWGGKTAMDIVTFADTGTPQLLRRFRRWAKSMGANTIQITNVSGNPRYDRLIQRVGFVPTGNLFTEIS